MQRFASAGRRPRVTAGDARTHDDNGLVVTEVQAPAPAGGRPPTRSTAGDRVRFAFEVLGELLITFGIVVLLFAVYELKVTDLRNAATQRGLSSDLQRVWNGQTPTRPGGPDPVVNPVKGQPFAIIRMS